MRDAALGRSRGPWIVGGIVLAVVFAVVALVAWLPGPRAALPNASGPSGSSSTGTARWLVGLPDPKRTPASINPNVTQDTIATTICMRGWATTVRPPSAYTGALKVAQIIEYGYADRNPAHYQEDHLVPLELGGAPRDPRNLWPEPNVITLADGSVVGSDAKDNLEDELHGRVCDGEMLLADAQRLIAGDWIAAWEAAGRP